jgi:protease I
MEQALKGKRVAVLATDGVEQVEFTAPVDALRGAGAEVVVVSIKPGSIQAMNHDDKGDTFPVDKVVSEVKASDFAALVLPGGVANPDFLRLDQNAVRFARSFFEQGKPVGVICHGPWTLVEADVVRGRTITSWPSLRTDLRNAGATWVDQEVVTDEGLVSSRRPDDLPAFCRKIVEEFAEGRHEGQRQAVAGSSARS